MRVQILGILNVTPDSFSDGSDESVIASRAIKRGVEMYEQGAHIIDIGGESTRPGFETVDADLELERVLPVIRGLLNELAGVRVSIDTRKSVVAEEALLAGASVVNAYGGLDDPAMYRVVARHRCMVIAYHTATLRYLLPGTAFEMVRTFFFRQEELASRAGLTPEMLVLDPGIGFGKSLDQNTMLLSRLHMLAKPGRQLMIGISRKGHIGSLLRQQLTLSETPGSHERLAGGLAETAIAIDQGVTYVRTHDVRETRDFVAIWKYLHDLKERNW